MAKIIGNTTATPNPRPDWTQTDETKADYIKNKPDLSLKADLVDGKIVESQLPEKLLGDNIHLDYENYQYDLSNIENQYIIKGPEQEDGSRRAAAGIVFSPYGSNDNIGDVNEYGASDRMIVDGKSTFAAGRNIKLEPGSKIDGSTGKPNYSSAFGCHHQVAGYGVGVFGNGNYVYPDSQYSFTAGQALSNFGKFSIIGGVSTNKFHSVVTNLSEVNTPDKLLEVFESNSRQIALAYGGASTNFGQDNITRGDFSITLGRGNFVGGEYGVSLGHSNTVMSDEGFALGTVNNVSNGMYSIALGHSNDISSYRSYVFGAGNTINGANSSTIGESNTINGTDSYIIGNECIAYGNKSYLLGYQLRGSSSIDAVRIIVGRCNAVDDTALFSVGNGITPGEGKNAFTVHYDGHAEIQTQGTTDKSVVRLDYFTAQIGDIETALDSIIAIQEELIGGAE